MKRKAKVFDLSFVELDFSEVFMEWLSYKEEIKDQYKTQRGIELAYKKLKNLSNHNPETAMKIIEESIEHGWKGLFPLKNERISFSQQKRGGASIFDAADFILQENQPRDFYN